MTFTTEERLKMLRHGPVKRIHVDQAIMKANHKQGRNDPPITIQTSKGPIKAGWVHINGPSTFLYQGDDPLSCGARLWIETHAEVMVE